jgi:hypothetical protein
LIFIGIIGNTNTLFLIVTNPSERGKVFVR